MSTHKGVDAFITMLILRDVTLREAIEEIFQRANIDWRVNVYDHDLFSIKMSFCRIIGVTVREAVSELVASYMGQVRFDDRNNEVLVTPSVSALPFQKTGVHIAWREGK